MRQNVGGWDRNTRWVLGSAAAIAALAVPLPKWWRIGLLSFATTEFVTAATGYCPVNQALGVDTRSQDLAEATAEAVETAKDIA